MIVVNNLSIGDEVWCLETHYNYNKRKRLTFIDDEGNEWERYDVAKITYSINKKTLVGNVIGVATGVINEEDSDVDNEYHFQHEDGLIYYVSSWARDKLIEEQDWFLTEADAIARKDFYETENSS